MKRVMVALLLMVGILAAVVPGVQARPSAASKEVDSQFTIGPETKVYDMGPHFGKTPPAGWTKATFDDSNWDSATNVRALPGSQRPKLAQFTDKPVYWGQYQKDYYLFRLTFTLPHALGYHGFLAVVPFQAPYKDSNYITPGYFHMLLNGRTVPAFFDTVDARRNYSLLVTTYLVPGVNVVAVYAGPTTTGAGLWFQVQTKAWGVQDTSATTTPTATTTSPLTGTAQAPTLFSHGPELYVSPTMGKAGQKVQVIGLGYTPGTCVLLEAGPPGVDFGDGSPPPAACAAGQIHIGPVGTFRTTFTIPASLRPPMLGNYQPVVVMTYNPQGKTEAEYEKAMAIFLAQ